MFILFFQPFSSDIFDFDNMLLFVAGQGTIVFLLMVLIRITLALAIQNGQISIEWGLIAYFESFLILAMSSVALAFYLHYVGLIDISFYIMIKVILICMAPPVVLRVYDKFRELKQQNALFIQEKKILQKHAERYEEDYLNKTVEFISENNAENLNLVIANVAFIKSADNYVEIAYKEGDSFKKKLIRNTLKNIEQQIKPYSHFIRCHRVSIVNINFIEKFNRNHNNHWLIIKGYNEQIPVSRQYLLKLKEILLPVAG